MEDLFGKDLFFEYLSVINYFYKYQAKKYDNRDEIYEKEKEFILLIKNKINEIEKMINNKCAKLEKKLTP